MDPAGALVVGLRVDERYTLRRRLGDGTFGEVWSALDTRFTERMVAIKFLKAEFLDWSEVVERFENEAEALGMLHHPNIVGVSDRGVWRDRRFIVVEYVEGTSLESWLEALPAERRLHRFHSVRAIFDQVCAGVAAAHAVRAPGPIVHRDLKPANVMLCEQPDGEYIVKVLDFGIAQLGGQKNTHTSLMGTPLYMAPEQGLGMRAEVGTWSDVFALGVILVEMLTGYAQPESDATWWGFVVQRSAEVPTLLDELCVGVPEPVREVLLRALRTKGSERYTDAGELRQAFRRACADAPPSPIADPPVVTDIPARPPPTPLALDDPALRSTDAQVNRNDARTRRRRAIAILSLLVAAAVAAGTVATRTSAHRDARPAHAHVAVVDPPTRPAVAARTPVLAATSAPLAARVEEAPADASPPPVATRPPPSQRVARRSRDAAGPRTDDRPPLPRAPGQGHSWSNIPLAPVFHGGGPR